MRISILGYGRLWTARRPAQHRGAAYFNTTAVIVGGKARPRSCVYGYVRIDQCSGFHPENSTRAIHRVYDTDGLSVWLGRRKLFLKSIQPKGTDPDRYLVRVSHIDIGHIERAGYWLSETGEVVSFSEGNDQQEALLVLPAFGWVRGGAGLFYLAPETDQPWVANLERVGR